MPLNSELRDLLFGERLNMRHLTIKIRVAYQLSLLENNLIGLIFIVVSKQ